jgi:hypothetical protein
MSAEPAAEQGIDEALREWQRRWDEWLNLLSFGEWVDYVETHGCDPRPEEWLAKWEHEGDPRAARLRAWLERNRIH